MQPTIHFPSIHKAIALAFSFTLCASESTLADEEISLRFVSFPKATDVKPLELLKSDSGTIEIEASTTHIPNAIQVPHMKEWNIGESDPDDQKPFSFSSYGKVDALDCKEQLVLILRQKPKESKELKLIAFDNVKDFKGGHYLVVNHSDKTITGVIGTRQFNFQTGEFGILEPIASDIDNVTKRAYTDVAFSFENENQPFIESRWRFGANVRTIVFFYNDPHTNQVRIHSLRDYL